MGEVWYVSTSAVLEQSLLARCRALLSDDERTRLDAFHFDRHRHEYLATRALCRGVLSTTLGCAPEQLSFCRNDYGKPELVPRGALDFNLANSVDLAVCAIEWRRSIGVDTEPLTSAERVLDVARTVFVRRELESLARLDGAARREHAVRLWTLKEAYMKARGMGMSLPPQSFAMSADEEDAPVLVDVPRDDACERWALATRRIDDHIVATCVERSRAGDDAMSYRRADLAATLLR